ncbi:phosphatidate phosphatase LPIN3 isoform X2 [Macrotis lagotis]|uniref:phosphatidate phosphatase LPIN3 isoform X2 n=1 Tax=Macrotis lagotis TaxID=92651 RepID=UPI003D691D6F
MNYVGQLAESVLVTVKELYQGLNPATLSGGIDVLVVKQPDGSFLCSPFHVRFGKLGVLRSHEQVVDIEINGEPVDLQMKLGDNGEAFFVKPLDSSEEEVSDSLRTSPIPLDNLNEILNDPLLDLFEDGSRHNSGISTIFQEKKKRRRKKVKKKSKMVTALSPNTSSEDLHEIHNVMLQKKCSEISSSLSLYNEDYMSACSQDSNLDVECKNQESFCSIENASLESKDSDVNSLWRESHSRSLSSDYLTSFRSVSEMEISQSIMKTDSHMQWHWGKLPKMVKNEEVKPLRASQSNTAITPHLWKQPPSRNSSSETLAETQAVFQDAKGISGSPSMLLPPVFNPSCVGKQNVTFTCDYTKYCPLARKLKESQDSLAQNNEKYLEENTQEMGSSPGFNDGQQAHSSGADKREQGEINLGNKLWSKPSCSDLNLLKATVVGKKSVGHLSNPTLDPEISIELSLCGGLTESRDIPPEKFAKYAISYQDLTDNPGILEDPNLVVKIGKEHYNWAVSAPMILSLQAFQKSLPESTIDKLMKEKMSKKSTRWWFSWVARDAISEKNDVQEMTATSVAPTSRQNFIQQEHKTSFVENDPFSKPVVNVPSSLPQTPTFKKSLRLSSNQIRDLNLKEGANDVIFSVTTQYQGTCCCHANIYLWNWFDKVVISDIDGTITKSDALGHILPQLGKDWTHHGIIKLYHKIHLEVIERKPEVFKIECLTDIHNLFLPHGDPFFAGFGNRPSDVFAYLHVEIPKSRIFTVNPQGELIQELIKNHKTSYDRLRDSVELMFPPITAGPTVQMVDPEFSQFCFWRDPLLKIHLKDLESLLD